MEVSLWLNTVKRLLFHITIVTKWLSTTCIYIILYGRGFNYTSVGLGVGISELYDNNMAWMLNRWKVRFLEYPRPRDKIKVETWCSSIDRFYALRVCYLQYGRRKNN